jgi:ABC-2 type transport system permease protein
MTISDTTPDSGSKPSVLSATATTATRPFYWSLRREFWEHRALYMAPLVVAGLLLVGFIISLLGLHGRARELAALAPAEQAAAIAQPYDFAAVAIIVTGVIVSVFYCLGALHNERRDRTILFWKSLPVSDLTTVLAKASIPVLILPLINFVIIVAMQVLMLMVNSVGRLAIGFSAALLWTQLPLFQMEIVVLYGLLTQALWYAPIFAWLLLVSAWARRTPFLWAVLAPLALGVVEGIAFNTHYFGNMLAHRLFGGFAAAFNGSAKMPHGMTKGEPNIPIVGLEQLDPAKFLSSPGLWFGLIVAAMLLAGAIWLRRYREPI